MLLDTTSKYAGKDQNHIANFKKWRWMKITENFGIFYLVYTDNLRERLSNINMAL